MIFRWLLKVKDKEIELDINIEHVSPHVQYLFITESLSPIAYRCVADCSLKG